jgi:hypothetical protein
LLLVQVECHAVPMDVPENPEYRFEGASSQTSRDNRRWLKQEHPSVWLRTLGWLDAIFPATRWRLLHRHADPRPRAQPYRSGGSPPTAGVREPRAPQTPRGTGSMAIDPDTEEAR